MIKIFLYALSNEFLKVIPFFIRFLTQPFHILCIFLKIRIMKYQYLGFIVIAVILFGSCTPLHDDGVVTETDFENHSFLVGKWKMVGSYQSNGGPQYYSPVSNGKIVEFTSKGTFTSSEFPECKEGTYVVDDNELTLNYHCENFDKQFPDLNGKFVFSISNESAFLLLSPISIRCIEGCSTKYQKVSD